AGDARGAARVQAGAGRRRRAPVGDAVRGHRERRASTARGVLLMLAQTAPIVPLVTPSATNVVGLLPELVLGGGFVVLMLLDLFVPASRRAWLAPFALAAIAASFGASMWGW